MLPQINWLKDRKNQLVVTLIGLQLYLILGVILPSYEDQPYYREKIATLQHQHEKLKQQALHIDYYQNRKEATVTTISELRKELEEIQKAESLQNNLNALLKSHKIKIVTQQITPDPSNPDFEIIKISQTMNGSFSKLINYLKDFNKLNPHLLITQTSFINQSPLKADPVITLNLKSQAFSPKKL